MGPFKRVYDWACLKVHAPFATIWLGVLFLFELILFIPLDALLMLFCMEKKNRSFHFATIASFASTISGIVGYLLGLFLWDTIGPYIVGPVVSEDFFNRMSLHYSQYESLAVFVGALLPIPFKVVALSAGFCQVPFLPFIAAVLSARLLRFFFVAGAMYRFGLPIKAFIERHFNRIIVAVGAKVALTFAFFWALGQ